MSAMRYTGLNDFLKRGAEALAKGPVAVVLVEDRVELGSTLRHHLALGFREVLVVMPTEFDLPPDVEALVHRIDHSVMAMGDHVEVINRLIAAAPGIWMYYCFNAEYLFYPFCESRSVGEMLAFHAEERRDAMLSYVVDLYAPDLERCPDAVSCAEAHLDRSGYFALARPDPESDGRVCERQLDVFGGLRWRFEEHVPPERRRIDRIA